MPPQSTPSASQAIDLVTQTEIPEQLEFRYAPSLRVTPGQYAYATVRGRMPETFSDWQCKLIAEGWSEEGLKGVTRKQSKEVASVTARWNRLPGVQAQIEYERAISLENRMAEPLRAWEARMEKLLALAAGELPQVRTIARATEEGKRLLEEEEYRETNLTALAKALEMTGRALGVFKDKTELSGPDGAALPAIQVSFVHPRDASSASSQGDDDRITPHADGQMDLLDPMERSGP